MGDQKGDQSELVGVCLQTQTLCLLISLKCFLQKIRLTLFYCVLVNCGFVPPFVGEGEASRAETGRRGETEASVCFLSCTVFV